MNIVFVDDGSSNRTLMAMSICQYMQNSVKSKSIRKVNFQIAALDKPMNMHVKAIRALEEFGSDLEVCNKKIIKSIDKISLKEKTRFIILGLDNKKKVIKKIVNSCKEGTVEVWDIDNPLLECKDEVRLRFYRRTRDQLWVKLEELVKSFKK